MVARYEQKVATDGASVAASEEQQQAERPPDAPPPPATAAAQADDMPTSNAQAIRRWKRERRRQRSVRRQRRIPSSTARAMLSQSHFKFKTLLRFKMARVGGLLIDCEEEFTSKTCSWCGEINEGLSVSPLFQCPSCGIRLDRDINAARNISHKNKDVLTELTLACSTVPWMRSLFLVAACTVAVSGASASGSASASSSTDVGDCTIGDWLANPLLVQCGVDGSYNFSSGVQPTLAQAEAMCGSSSCSTLFQAASLSTGVQECTLPFGDHIRLLADLVNYVLEICSASTSGSTSEGSSSSSSNATDATAAPSVATDSSSSSDGGSSTPAIVGVVVGVVVLLVLIAGLLWWRRRRQQHKRESTDGSSHHSQQPYAPVLTATGRNELLPGPVNTPGQSTNSTTTTASGASIVASSSQASKKQHARLSDLAPWRVNVDDIQDLERIGHGAHGVVWRVMYRGETVLASKRIQTDQISPKRTQDFIDEIALVSRLQHPNIVEFVGVAWTMESDLQVLLEFMDGGDLRSYLLKTETPRTWTLQKLSIALDVAQALSFVHSFQPPLLHRDLKSHNVMLIAGGVQDANTPPSSTETPLTAKLTDFGVSRFHSENNTMTVGVGTSRWLAPEVIVGKPNYGPEADMYSFGVVLSELDTHELPYDDARTAAGEPLANVAILQRVAMGQLKPTFHSEKCPPALLTLAHQCLEHDASKRPTAAQVASELRRGWTSICASAAVG